MWRSLGFSALGTQGASDGLQTGQWQGQSCCVTGQISEDRKIGYLGNGPGSGNKNEKEKGQTWGLSEERNQQESLFCLCGEGGRDEGAPAPQVSSFVDAVVGGATSSHWEMVTAVLLGRAQG